jgi:hypothetical protein
MEPEIPLGERVARLCHSYEAEARRLLADLIAVCKEEYQHNGAGGMSGHELTRLTLLRERIIALKAVVHDSDVYFDEFGSLIWEIQGEVGARGFLDR